jgi:hypothetical protein
MFSSHLLRPLDYLRIEHPSKRLYDFVLPLILSVLFTGLLLVLPVQIEVLGSNGLVSIFTSLLQILIGFYIASLAAVATFDREIMDSVMVGHPPILKKTVKGEIEEEQLTRRRFLSLMFGYLSLLSFFLYFFGAFVNLLEPSLLSLTSVKTLPYLKWGFVFIFLFLASNLFITTLLSLYYMADRIHRDDPKLIIKEPQSTPKK